MNALTLVPTKWRRNLLNASKLRLSLGLIVCGLIISGPSFVGFVTKDGRLADGLRGYERIEVVAVLHFDPERHNDQLGQYNALSGLVNIRRLLLRSVSPDILEALAELNPRIEPMQ